MTRNTALLKRNTSVIRNPAALPSNLRGQQRVIRRGGKGSREVIRIDETNGKIRGRDFTGTASVVELSDKAKGNSDLRKEGLRPEGRVETKGLSYSSCPTAGYFCRRKRSGRSVGTAGWEEHMLQKDTENPWARSNLCSASCSTRPRGL